MNQLERKAKQHAAEWLRYARSPQAKRDLDACIAKRREIDRKAGHSFLCGILECHPTCKQMECK